MEVPGHRWTKVNTRIHPKRGVRICRRCEADRRAACTARKKAAA